MLSSSYRLAFGASEDHVELLEWIINLILLAVFVTWIVILSSRCCAPCCCGPQMPDVPQPCPVGPLSCENLPLLDYPMLIAFGGEFLTGFLVALVYSITDGFLNPRDRDVAGTARLISVAWIALAVVGAATGLRKFRLMRERPPSVPVGTPVVGTPHNQVVGAPIAGKVVN